MRLVIATMLLFFSSTISAQQLIFASSLSLIEKNAVNDLLEGDIGFKMANIAVARVKLNGDEIDDLVILFQRPAVCMAKGCTAHVLLSHQGAGGVHQLYKDAFTSTVRKIELGPIQDGTRTLKIDGESKKWDGKTFR